MSNTTAVDYKSQTVGELRSLMRTEFKEGRMFQGADSTEVARFINFAGKDKLVAACENNKIEAVTATGYTAGNEAAAPAPATTEATEPTEPEGAPKIDAMSFVQKAIDDAYAKGVRAGINKAGAEAESKWKPKLSALEEALKAAQQEQEAAVRRAQLNASRVTGATEAGNGAQSVPGAEAAPGSEAGANTGRTVDLLTRSQVLPIIDMGGAGIEIPNSDPHFLLDKNISSMLDNLWDLSKAEGRPKGALFVGPAGCGKSSTPEEWSARKARPYYKINAALLRESKEWFGSKSVLNGSLYFIMSEFCKALETPDCTVMIDEINRAIANALHSLLGVLDTGKTYVEELGRHVVCAKGVVVCASMNEGSQYHVHELDAALKDRFPIRIECSYLPEKEEVDVVKNKAGVSDQVAKQLVLLANTIRSKNSDATGMGGTLHETLSTRQVIEAAKMMNLRGKASLEYTITNRFSRVGGRDSEQCQVANIIQGIFG